ncbi:oligosaccharide flippase family protein [Leucobacter sp. cx-328]|uniref:lipopolysaccharide biosynthesis protein n=1 Tax=unclassified Leucobacter TaxID=2621730 RepID=UPI00165D75A5|nr:MULTISPECIES: oligosaccharide flippase family protein [unclassified Leucobacter]MBC9944647.1 oligosaccharide flippase family protein [Leucobacter sp. cx-328]
MSREKGRLRAYLRGNAFLRNVLTLMSGTALAQLLVLAVTPVLTRFYTKTEWGLLGTFASVVAIIVAIATLKYDMAVMLPESDDAAKSLTRVARWVSFTLCVVATVVIILIAPWVADLINAPAIAPWLALAGISAFTLTEIAILGYWLNRKSKYKVIATNRVLQSGTTAASQLALGFVKPLGVGGLIVGTILGQVVSVFALRKKTPELREGPKPPLSDHMRLMRRYRNMPLFNAPTALIDAVRMNGINLLIAAVSVSTFGQFSVAWRLVEVPAALISAALAQVFFQHFSVVERGHMLKSVVSSIKKSALVGVVPFALVWVLSPWLFPIVLGPGWDDAGYFAQALVPWLFMNLITSPISTIFVVTERQQISLIFSILYTAVPFAIILLLRDSIMTAVFVMGGAMALMLCVYIVVAIVVARRFDRQPTPDGA